MDNTVISLAMKHYDHLISIEKYERMKWAETRKRFSSVSSASVFFIGCLLNMGQPAERAWNGGKFFVEEYFPEETIWEDIAATHLNRLKKICTKGFDGYSFASHNFINKFAPWLKENALLMNEKYDGDPRNIWNGLSEENVEVLYERLMEFKGMGDALAKMTQFILVRRYGAAGGRASQKWLKIKPDIHLQRVLYRVGVTEEQTSVAAINWAESAELSSPADFDGAIWDIGREYCKKEDPNCNECPLSRVCEYDF